ncbi:hypothetical protein DFP92_10998 [Yoonia sediminilitoris]|uniref:Uncharacterized protein n=1 Tax=Yoonia sediminilitoris TaxID=1286148 RepID=A0A2T6KD14_9RHOB|nr:hypothetical protein C8N45_10998 [Yoonia sediminilitoris]RCW94267.1 hypothetical protein DFP92_10998 [Yoonia sediminilitoris]
MLSARSRFRNSQCLNCAGFALREHDERHCCCADYVARQEVANAVEFMQYYHANLCIYRKHRGFREALDSAYKTAPLQVREGQDSRTIKVPSAMAIPSDHAQQTICSDMNRANRQSQD